MASASIILNAPVCAMYTVETHVRYLREVRAPAELVIETIILGCDAKRMWFAHLMMVDGGLRATGEFMTLHYHTRENRTTAMPEPVQTALKKAKTAERPEWTSRRIALRKVETGLYRTHRALPECLFGSAGLPALAGGNNRNRGWI